MTNFEYYVAGNRASEGWHEFLTNYYINKKGAEKAIDQYNKWLLEEYDPHILDDIEKKYLSNVIKPFRDRIINIAKVDCGNGAYHISVAMHSNVWKSGKDAIVFPDFSYSLKMYKNMKLNYCYSLKELGL